MDFCKIRSAGAFDYRMDASQHVYVIRARSASEGLAHEAKAPVKHTALGSMLGLSFRRCTAQPLGKVMNQDRFEAGEAPNDLDTSESNHDAVAGPIWTAMDETAAAMDSHTEGNQVLRQLLRGMRETHGSMRTIFGAATAIERAQEQSGRWTDILVLARSQFDAVFAGLLIADDEASWTSAYKKAGWETMAQRHFYQVRRFENTPSGQALKTTNVMRLQRLAEWAGITSAEWSATEAQVWGKSNPPGAQPIKRFPTPGTALQKLRTASFQELGRLLYPPWKFLCDAAHAGLATLLLRALIRDVPGNAAPGGARDDFIYKQVGASLGSSLAAGLTLVTVAALPHCSNADLCDKIVAAWEPIERGTLEGNVIWHQWARRELGVLEA